MIVSRDPASWLRLAATPTFAAMALLTHLSGADLLCVAGAGPWPLGGMVPMYVLMSAFHAPPWLRLAKSLRGGALHS